MAWQNLNNKSGFCCFQEWQEVRFEIGRNIPGTNNFAEIYSSKHFSQESQDFDNLPLQTFSLAELCNNNRDAPIRFSVWTKQNKMINEVKASINQIEDSNHHFTGQEDAQLALTEYQLFEKPSFCDYLRAGWGISVVGAIDYTASNGNPTQSGTLHNIGFGHNQYQRAILNVGGVIEPYDHDRSFPFFGFGGIPRHMGLNQASHCFAINGNMADPEIQTIQGVLDAYQQSLPNIGLSGPTLFAPLLEQFLQHVNSVKEVKMCYQILLILTDGAIHDMPKTREILVQLSQTPASVIIIGVGDADFSAM